MQKIKPIITGATGMVGEGVLLVCLHHPDVEEVLVINRKPCGIVHPKLKEIIHNNFYDLLPIENQLQGYNACFFCLGISSVSISKKDYYKITYTLTLHVGETLSRLNNDMTFCYISGAGTSEKGWQNWAQVKAKTETALMKLPFKKAFALRPGFIKPVSNQKQAHSFYKFINWMFPIGRKLFPGGFCTMEELALSMIHLAQNGYRKTILEGKDILEAAKV